MKRTEARKTLLSCAIATGLGLGPAIAAADTILRFTIEDIGSTVRNSAGELIFDPTLDGESGGFAFSTINPVNFQYPNAFRSDIGDMLWNGSANPTGSFTSGFDFGTQFIPFTFGNNAVGTIDIVNTAGGTALTVTSLDFGGAFGSVNFVLPPDIPPGVSTNWLVNNGDGTFGAQFQWEHIITTAEDATGNFVNQNARWILEGTAILEDGPPSIFLTGADINNGAVTVLTGSPYVEAGVDCVDLVDGPINSNLAFTTDPAGVDLNMPAASFERVYNCTDTSAGLDAVEVRRTVTVSLNDTTPPGITLLGCNSDTGIDCSMDGSENINTVNILKDRVYMDGGATCFDDVDLIVPFGAPGSGLNFSSMPFPSTVDTGTLTNGVPVQIAFTCRDSAGLSSTDNRSIFVLEDTFPPFITRGSRPDPVTVTLNSLVDPGLGVSCRDRNPVDNPGGNMGSATDITENLDFNSVDTSIEGSTVVTYTCSDDAGNTATPETRTFNVVSGEAFNIISMTISDTDGDGLVGCFRFLDLNNNTCLGANRFSSDGSAFEPDPGGTGATIPGSGTDIDVNTGLPIGIRFGVYQPDLLQIAPGFMYLGFPFQPFTFNPPSEDADVPTGVVIDAGGGVLFFEMASLPFSGLFSSDQPNAFFLDPDEQTFETLELIFESEDVAADTRIYTYKATWSHLITNAEDPTGRFANFNAFWRLEGEVTTDATAMILNNPPTILSVRASQGANAITQITVSEGGIVTVTADAVEPNLQGITYLWEGVTPIDGNVTGSSIMFDPAVLETGPLTLRVTATDVVTPPTMPQSSTEELVLDIVGTPPDPDFGDDDDDSIPNYLDRVDGNADPLRNAVDPLDPAAGEVVASEGRLRIGSTAHATGSGSFLITEGDVGVEDNLNRIRGLGHSGGGIFDFEVFGIRIGGAVKVVLPQAVPLPNTPIYRKFIPGRGWFTFTATAGNQLASAMRVGGVCPGPDDDIAYDDAAGLIEGHECIRVTGVDGGLMDGDGVRNGKFRDPGTGAGNGAVPSGGGVSSGGCNVTSTPVSPTQRGDWWILALFAAGLGWTRRKFRRSRM